MVNAAPDMELAGLRRSAAAEMPAELEHVNGEDISE